MAPVWLNTSHNAQANGMSSMTTFTVLTEQTIGNIINYFHSYTPVTACVRYDTFIKVIVIILTLTLSMEKIERRLDISGKSRNSCEICNETLFSLYKIDSDVFFLSVPLLKFSIYANLECRLETLALKG